LTIKSSEQKFYPPPPAPPEPTGKLPYDSKEFGLTYEEYEILIEDYERAIEEGNRKYGYGGRDYLGKTKVGSGAVAKAVKKSKIQESKDRDLFLSFIHEKMKAADPAAKQHFADTVDGVTYNYKPERPSIEELAIRRGIIKVHRPSISDGNDKEESQ
jgi:hypothetical protein